MPGATTTDYSTPSCSALSGENCDQHRAAGAVGHNEPGLLGGFREPGQRACQGKPSSYDCRRKQWRPTVSRDSRLELIRGIEEQRGSRVMTYICSDRPGGVAQIHEDAIRSMCEHVRRLGKVPRLDLFLSGATRSSCRGVASWGR